MTSRRLLAVLGGLALAWGGALGSAQAATTGLSGTITGSDGSPISGCVTVYDLQETTVDWTCSDDSGVWELPGVPDGTYRVAAEPQVGGWAREFAYGARSFASATDITSPGVVDIELDPAYDVTGVVTDVDGAGLESIMVTAYDELGNMVAASYSWMDGTWWLSLPAGDFRFEFSGAPGTIWYKDAANLDAATPVTVSGATTVNQSFLGPASVTGRVLDRSGQPIDGACAQLSSPNDDTVYTGGAECRGALTGPDGRYTLAPEDYQYGQPMTVAAYDPQGRYAGQLAGNTRDLTKATTYVIQPGASIEVATITLLGGGSMTGRTVVADTLAPLSGICPSAMLGAGDQPWGVVTTCSNANGRYTVKACRRATTGCCSARNGAAGTSTPGTTGPTPAPRPSWSRSATARPSPCAARGSSPPAPSLARCSMPPAPRSKGSVSMSAGSTRHSSAAATRRCAQRPTPRTVLDPGSGGTYKPLASDYRGRVATAFSGNVGTSRLATPVTVSESAPATLDFRMVRGLTITGTFETTSPSWQLGRVFTASGDLVGQFSSTDPETEFGTSRLLPGTYKLQLEGSGIWYEATLNAASATKIELTRSAPVHVTWNLDLPTSP
ncbi:MAG: carboxypeptidase regulatory-like domain-containing protein [Tetrasphaera sp.]|nr:carboxypeptidase regulatory-like domain-containing protein [Tetrasphaera sp.]